MTLPPRNWPFLRASLSGDSTAPHGRWRTSGVLLLCSLSLLLLQQLLLVLVQGVLLLCCLSLLLRKLLQLLLQFQLFLLQGLLLLCCLSLFLRKLLQLLPQCSSTEDSLGWFLGVVNGACSTHLEMNTEPKGVTQNSR